jgi:starch synthase/alpha-amylase
VGKIQNKRYLQNSLGLLENDNAPLFFWPSRLDNNQKGCQLLAEILYRIVDTYWDEQLQIISVANGAFKEIFRDIVRHHGLEKRVAICDFDERISRLAYAGSDFILMPSLFEPCGLPQMIAPIYGSLPVARDTGGIHDTVVHLDVSGESGNGFLFEHYDSQGLFWAIGEAMRFHALPIQERQAHISRIMKEAREVFNHDVTARKYMDLYERMLMRPLIN